MIDFTSFVAQQKAINENNEIVTSNRNHRSYLWLDSDFYNDLSTEAERTNTTMTDVIRQAIEDKLGR